MKAMSWRTPSGECAQLAALQATKKIACGNVIELTQTLIAKHWASCVPHIQPQRSAQGAAKSLLLHKVLFWQNWAGCISTSGHIWCSLLRGGHCNGWSRAQLSLCLTHTKLLYLFVMFLTYLFKSLMTFKWKISCWLKAGRGIAGKMKCTIHNQIQMTCSPGFWGNEANEYSEPLVIRFEQPGQRERRGWNANTV